MILEVVKASNELPIVIIVGSLAFIGFVVWAVTRRTIEPWWRKYPKPSKMAKICRDIVRAYKVRQKFPQAFDPNDPLYMPVAAQRFLPEDVTKIAEEVVRLTEVAKGVKNDKQT